MKIKIIFFQGTVVKAPTPEYTDKSMKFYIRLKVKKRRHLLSFVYCGIKKSQAGKETDFGLTSQKDFSVTVMAERHTNTKQQMQSRNVFDCHLKYKEILQDVI